MNRKDKSTPLKLKLFSPKWLASLLAVFIVGIGVGVGFSATASFTPQNVASRTFIDQSAPNPELCVQYGASAITVDTRAFVTLNPFNVYLAQPSMEPGCILRSSNWEIIKRRNLISQEQLQECKQRMNTFGFTGTLEGKPEIDCVYQNDSAKNFFFEQEEGLLPSETDNF